MIDAENTVTIDITRLKSMIKSALDESFKNDPLKTVIHLAGNRLNFSCPYCGDSKDHKKKRGNFYIDTLSYKCYNGGCGVFKNLTNFLDDFGCNDLLTADEKSDINQITRDNSNRRRVRSTVDYFISENYKDVIIKREYLKEKLGLIECRDFLPIKEYLEKRNQILDKKFLWEPKRRNLFILNLTSDESCVIGLQIRNMSSKDGSKYFTYKLSGIYEKLLKIKDLELIKKSSQVDPISNVFGFSTVDLESMITVFEGPFDSFLSPNSIALCSINNSFPFDVNNKRYFYDSDHTGRDKMRELLSHGNMVFLWEKFIRENNLPERDKWDLNDVVNHVRSTGTKIKRLDNYFSNNQWDLLEV